MERGCFLLNVKQGRLDDYLVAHEKVWPELLESIRQVGIRNYSMFVKSDGLLVAYMEGDNLRESLEQLAATDVSKRWQQHMAEFFDGEIEANWLEQYFYVD